ncbi:MAG TPA: DUF2188 domain-containing protein [Woeseiaceae bacterium]|nr:DUF2188 domain-containing protein [Woeseiaceae bacterium]
MQHYHLVKRANLWQLEEEGSEEAILSAATKAAALEQTEEFMSDRDGAVWIHKADGELLGERTFSANSGSSRLTAGLTWATIATIGVTFAAGAALAWYFRKDLRDLDLDRIRGLLSR